MIYDVSNTWFLRATLAVQEGAPPAAGCSGTAAASDGGAAGSGTAATAAPDGSFLFMMIIPLLVLMVVFSLFSQRREKKRRAQMLGGMKKHDTVRTIGGVIGSVVAVKPDTVVLKVDESSNTCMTFSRDAVQLIMEAETSAADETELAT